MGAAAALQPLEVGVQGARIAGQVLAGAELAGIDEDRHHDRVALRHGRPHQAQMPFVQGSHRRHQSHALALPPQGR